MMENCYENKCSCGRVYYGDKLQPFCASCYDIKLRTAEQERGQYKAERDAAIGITPTREGFPELDKDHLIRIAVRQSVELESLRAKIKEVQDGSPSEIEMHRMAFKIIQDYGFSCPEALLAAYKHLEKSQVRLSKEAAEALDECERM